MLSWRRAEVGDHSLRHSPRCALSTKPRLALAPPSGPGAAYSATGLRVVYDRLVKTKQQHRFRGERLRKRLNWTRPVGPLSCALKKRACTSTWFAVNQSVSLSRPSWRGPPAGHLGRRCHLHQGQADR